MLQQHELEAALEQLLQRASSQHAADEVLGEIIMETGASTRAHTHTQARLRSTVAVSNAGEVIFLYVARVHLAV